MKMNINQPPLNTTMMGVIRGVADYLSVDLSTPSLYGRSGHAFLLNIHEAICPSGPYCWKYHPFIDLLENIGIKMEEHGFFSTESSLEERSNLEKTLKEKLLSDNPCSIVNLDNQLISGFDELGFDCIQPWEMDFPPSRLSFGSWEEIKEEIHACFYSFSRCEPSDPTFSIQKSLLYALDLSENPANHTTQPYFCGLQAYDAWIKGVKNGYGGEHGNWWNGTVWSECRKMGSEYFMELSASYPACSDTCMNLSRMYGEVSDLLERISSKELQSEKKIVLLEKAADIERDSLDLIRQVAETIET